MAGLRKTGLLAVVLAAIPHCCTADVWQLQNDQEWHAIADSTEGFDASVSELKNLIVAGRAGEARRAAERLKARFPEAAGDDFDAFMEAELLLSKGHLDKAAVAYERFLKDHPKSPLVDAALDRQYAVATAYLNGRKRTVLKFFKVNGYAEGEKIMDQIAQRAGDAPIAAHATAAVAVSLEERKKFELAYEKWSHLAAKWPDGRSGSQAMLNQGRCQQAAYRGPDYDSSGLASAEGYYRGFTDKNKDQAEKLGLENQLQLITEQKAFKQYCIARYYDAVDNPQAANLYYRMVADTWPQTAAGKAAGDAMRRPERTSHEKKWYHGMLTAAEWWL